MNRRKLIWSWIFSFLTDVQLKYLTLNRLNSVYNVCHTATAITKQTSAYMYPLIKEPVFKYDPMLILAIYKRKRWPFMKASSLYEYLLTFIGYTDMQIWNIYIQSKHRPFGGWRKVSFEVTASFIQSNVQTRHYLKRRDSIV